jgi:hypothetical protein
MSNVATSAPVPPNNPPGDPGYHLISSAEMLRSKVGTVLAVMGQCMPMILESTEDGFESKALRAKYEGGCSDSAQVTYINACSRLDTLLQDDSNWEVSRLDSVMKERSQQLHDLDLQIAQQKLAREKHFNRPSVRMQANLFRKGNVFYAALGSTMTDDSIYGSGASPEAAYLNLDEILSAMDSPASKPAKKK